MTQKNFRRVSMTNNERVGIGFELTLGIVGFVMLIIGALSITGALSMNDTLIDEPSFEVVDKYKECDVVRYAPQQTATYKYFLYCEKNK